MSVALAVVLGVVAPLGLVASPAAAAHQYLWWNGDGATFRTFGANATIRIYQGAVEYECDFVYPTADVYVVPTGQATGQLTDVSGSPNTVQGLSGGLFIEETIGFSAPGGTIGPGTYAVVYDECQDGKVDPGDFVLDPAFEVKFTGNPPDINPRIAQLKADAGEQAGSWGRLLKILAAWEKIQEIKGTIECLASGGAACAVSQLTDYLKEKANEAAMAALGVQDPKEGTKKEVENLVKHYAGIHADPPDPNYRQPSPLTAVGELRPDDADPAGTAEIGLGNAVATEARISEALLHSIERYQGADAAGDVTWALVHAQEAQAYVRALREQMALTDGAADALAQVVLADSDGHDAARAFAEPNRARFAEGDFTADERRALDDLGFDAAETQALQEYAAGLDYAGYTTQAFLDELGTVRDLYDFVRPHLQTLETDLGDMITLMKSDPALLQQAPVADAGGPYQVDEGATVTLDASGSVDHDSAIAEHAWDLDRDGAFDDATGATTAFTPDADFRGLVGVRVTDDAGLTTVDYARVEVRDVNGPPTLSLAPADAVQDTSVGSAHTISATASDPDGDPVQLRWFLDGTEVGTGTSWSLTAGPQDVGLRDVRVEARDGRPGGTTVTRVGLRVRHPDADGDGWRADVDCDDGDDQVHPGRNEVIGNGVDDDCDPTTLDEGNPPTAEFEHRPVVGSVGLPMTFTDASSDPDDDLVGWVWDFGDGATSTEQNPEHTYAARGTYPVSLTVTDAQGSSATVRHDVRVAEAPTAAFSWSPEEPLAGETVRFADESADADGPIAGWDWDFGDGGTATGPSPTHVYDGSGTYTVELTVTDEDGQSATATQELRVQGPPVAAFGTSRGINVAAAANGGSVDAASGATPSLSPDRVIDRNPSTAWRSATGATTDQWLRLKLGSRQVVDRVVVTVPNNTTAAKDFELLVSATGNADADFTSVLTGTLAQQAGPQELTFTPTSARYVTLVLRTNHGSTTGTSVGEVEIWTRARTGGIVSLLEGARATVVGSSGSQPSYPPEQLLDDNASTYWRSATGQTTNQWVDVRLGGGRTYRVDRVRLQPLSGTPSVRNFEVQVSTTTTDDAAFTTVFSGAAANDGSLQTFAFPETQARFVRLRVLDNHGSTSYVGLRTLEVLTRDGRSAARGAGVGATAFATSASQPANNAIDASDTTYWQTATGQTTGQALKVLLAPGGPHLVDRVRLRGDTSTSSVGQFELQVSATTDDPSAFTTVLEGTLPRDSADHDYAFAPTQARWARLLVHNNHGGTAIRLFKLALYSSSLGGPTVAFDDRSTDADGALASWHWDFGDGQTSTDRHPVHTYAAPGSYDVELTVTDADGLTATATGRYTVLAPPVAAFGWSPAPAPEGTSVAFRDETTTEGVVLAYQWQFAGINRSDTGAAPRYSYPDQGDYEVTLTTTDHTLQSSTVTRTVRIVNAPPTANAGADVRIFADQPWKPGASASDPGTADRSTLQCRWDFGDGSTPVERLCNQGAPEHTYQSRGEYTLTLTATDKDGASTSSTAQVTVQRRGTFVSVQAVPGTAAAGGVDVVARLWQRMGTAIQQDGADWQPYAGQQLTLTLGDEVRTLETDADGAVALRMPTPRTGGTVIARFDETLTHSPSSDEDPVPPSGLPPGDVVFVVDESGSMGGYQAKVRQNVTTIAQQLGASVDFQLGLVGFGDGWAGGMPHIQGPLTDDVDLFTRALGELSVSGGFEPGYDGVAFAVGEAMGHRPNAGSCVVLIADEPPQRRDVTKEQALAAVQARNAVVLSVVTTTYADKGYIELAEESGGQAFDLRAFSTDPQPVLTAIIDKCVAAIQARPDLSVTVDDGLDTMNAGQESTYTVTVSNDGASDVTGVVPTATVPTALTVGVVSDGGSAAGGTVTWPAVDLLAGESVTRTFTARLAPFAGMETVEVQASAFDDGSIGPDLTPANNASADTNAVAANAAPVAEDGGVETDEDTPVSITLSASDPDGDPLTYEVVQAPGHGTLGALDGDTVVYTPDPGYSGPEELTFRASDGQLESPVATVAITVRPVNDPPVAEDGAVETDEDTPVSITLTGSDPEGDPLAYAVVDGPGHGTLGDLDGDTVVYTPDPDFNGSDQLTFRVSDGELESSVATVAITVRPVNDAPVLTLSTDRTAAQYSDPVDAVTVTATDVDSDLLDLTFSGSGLPDGVAVRAVAPGRATVSGRIAAPAGSYSGEVTVSDGSLTDTEPLTVGVTREDATLRDFTPDLLAADGSDGDVDSLSVGVTVVEVDDGHPSSTLSSSNGLAHADPVRLTLTPVGPGPAITCAATNIAYSAPPLEAAGSCEIADAPVNVYDADAVIGGDYFTGDGSGRIATYDPGAGHVTGGGGYTAADGTGATFGFTAKYLPYDEIQGSLQVTHHRIDGPHSLKSTVLGVLAVRQNADGSWVATFTGTAHYDSPSGGGEGYRFTVYVEDAGEPGRSDRFWMEVVDPAGDVVDILSQPRRASAHAAALERGNIQVPHATR